MIFTAVVKTIVMEGGGSFGNTQKNKLNATLTLSVNSHRKQWTGLRVKSFDLPTDVYQCKTDCDSLKNC